MPADMCANGRGGICGRNHHDDFPPFAVRLLLLVFFLAPSLPLHHFQVQI